MGPAPLSNRTGDIALMLADDLGLKQYQIAGFNPYITCSN